MSLSICMMAKNEEESIKAVIKSYLYDQLIIGVDRFSKDNTKQIAQKYADDYFEFDFNNDFAEIRNKTIALAKYDWIAWPDAHEYLQESSREYVQCLNDIPDNVDAINVRLNIIHKGIIDNFFYSVKIFRNNIGIKFDYPIHATPVGIRKEHSVMFAPNIVLDHIRNDVLTQERHKQKMKINRKIFQDLIKKNPNDTRSLFYLGQCCIDAGDFEAAELYFKRYLETSKFRLERYQVMFYVGNILLNQNRLEEAYDLLKKSIAEDWRRNENMLLLGDTCLRMGRKEEALHWYRVCATMPEPVSPFFVVANCYSYVPLQKLVTLYAQLGRFDEALACAKEVKKYLPEEADEKIKQIEAKIEQIIETEKIENEIDPFN